MPRGALGDVEEAYIMKGKRGVSKGCAMARFKTRATGQAAIDALHEKYTFEGAEQSICIKWADSLSEAAAKLRAAAQRREEEAEAAASHRREQEAAAKRREEDAGKMRREKEDRAERAVCCCSWIVFIFVVATIWGLCVCVYRALYAPLSAVCWWMYGWWEKYVSLFAV